MMRVLGGVALAVFILLPLVQAVLLSFTVTLEKDGVAAGAVGLMNYAGVLAAPELRAAMVNSAVYVCLNVALCIGVGLPAAYALARFRFLVIGKPDAGRRPRRAMARVYDVPLDPALNDYMRTFHTRVFPADGMGKVELFLAALREHVEKAPDASTEAGKRELRRIWGAYEDESAPYLLCRLPRTP